MADDQERSRRKMRLDIYVDGPFGSTTHRHDHRLRILGIVHSTGFGANLHQTRAAGVNCVKALPANDVARTRTTDEPFHAPVGSDRRAIAKVRANRRAPHHDGCNRVRFLG